MKNNNKTQDLIDRINHLAELGFCIIPLKPKDKTPLFSWKKFQKRKPTEDEINNWVNKYPNMNIGVVAGEISDLTVIDIDTKEIPKGFSSTLSVETGKGYHLYYKYNPKVSTNVNADLKIDIRSEGGYIVAPGSTHPSGKKYEWITDAGKHSISELSDFEINYLKPSEQSTEDKIHWSDYVKHSAPIPCGQRNNILTSICGGLMNQHDGDSEIVETELLQINKFQCTKPLPEKDVKSIVTSIKNTYEKSENKKDINYLNEIQYNPDLYFFKDEEVPYAQVLKDGKRLNMPIDSFDFVNYARYKIYKRFKRQISDKTLRDILRLLKAKAMYSGNEHALKIRTALYDKKILYNPSNKEKEFVEISKEGWEIKPNSECPTVFKEVHSVSQVAPTKNGDLKDIFKIINIKNPDIQLLYLTILCTSLIPDIAHPIMYIHGPAGSGKTELLKKSKKLLDPCEIGVGSFPHKIEDFTIQVDQQWIAAFDNIGKINDELSDMLARTCTGDAKVRRTLYSNNKLTIFKLMNPLFLNGINLSAKKSDLLERTIAIENSLFVDGKRKTVSELDNLFEKLQPELLGAIFTTLSNAMSIKEELEPLTEFRLADYANWACACAMALGHTKEEFVNAYRMNTNKRAYDALRSSNVGRAIMLYIEKHNELSGLSSDVFHTLKSQDLEFEFGTLAHSVQGFGMKINELENSFKKAGIKFEKKHTSSGTYMSFKKSDNRDNLKSVISVSAPLLNIKR